MNKDEILGDIKYFSEKIILLLEATNPSTESIAKARAQREYLEESYLAQRIVRQKYLKES